MQRSLTIERLFSLGNYSNIKISHTMTDIPENIALSRQAMGLVQDMLLLDVEYEYRRYQALTEKLGKLTDNASVLEMIDAERESTFEQLFALTHKGE